MSLNAQTVDFLGSSAFTFGGTALSKKPSVCRLIHEALPSAGSYVKRTQHTSAYWDTVNRLSITAGSTLGMNKGFGTLALGDCTYPDSAFVDIRDYVATLLGGYLVTWIGYVDVLCEQGGVSGRSAGCEAYWTSYTAVVDAVKAFLLSQQQLGKTIIYHNIYPVPFYEDEADIVAFYTTMQSWCGKNGMHYIDLRSKCPTQSNGYLPVDWIVHDDETHLTELGCQEIAALFLPELIPIFNSSGSMG